jgi:low affinity Fe/Cu permease
MSRPANRPVHLSDRKLGQSPFDRFATGASDVASRGVFFAACVLLVLLWAPSYFVIGDVDTWQLVINTATTIVTFLLVALLQNAQRRSEQVMQRKLNALARGIEDILEQLAGEDPGKIGKDIKDLRVAIGLEDIA